MLTLLAQYLLGRGRLKQARLPQLPIARQPILSAVINDPYSLIDGQALGGGAHFGIVTPTEARRRAHNTRVEWRDPAVYQHPHACEASSTVATASAVRNVGPSLFSNALTAQASVG